MDKIIDQIVMFLTNPDIKRGFKAVLILAILWLLVLLNNYTYFLKSISIANKTQAISHLSGLMADTTFNARERAAFRAERRKIAQSEPVITSVYSNVFEFRRVRSLPGVNASAFFWSSCWTLIVAYAMVIFKIATKKDATKQDYIISVSAGALLCWLAATFELYLFSLIPKIGAGWGWNYFANSVASILIPNLLLLLIPNHLLKKQSV